MRTEFTLTKIGSSVVCVGGNSCEEQQYQRIADILSGTQKWVENSTVAQGCQGTGFASPVAALTALCHSALRY